MVKKYVVYGEVNGNYTRITEAMSKKKAEEVAKNLKTDMRKSIWKYKWARRISVGKLEKVL